MLTNMDKLYESVAANGPVCVGLDTEIGYLPATDAAKTAGENVVDFNRALIDATKGVAGCYKVQIAYYESLGLDGMRAYAETLKLARATGLPVIADIKRGDIAKTAEMYAKAHFTGDFEADIVLVDLDHMYEVHADELHSKSKNCPYDGALLYGKVVTTIKGGKVTFQIEE